MSQQLHTARVIYDVPAKHVGWELPDETMPESVLHDEAVELLKALLAAWAARTDAGFVVRNLAVRWDEQNPNVGVDPDVALLSPAPPDVRDLSSLCTWEPGHVAPRLAIEVVSPSNAHKDYSIAPDKYAACGAGELWIFDPLLAGPKSHSGPFRIQIWRREGGAFRRVYAGEGPVRSETIGAWLVAVDEGRKLRVADDEAATRFWLTPTEAERAAKEQERAAKDAALARVAELEAELRRRGAG
jgi:Uma2 family endonuclease